MKLIQCVGLAAASLFAAPVAAELIVYTHEGSGSGTLGGDPFEDTGFVITTVADTDDSESLLPYSTYIVHQEADITIDGVGTFELTEPTTTMVDHLFGGVAFGILLDFGGGVQEPGPVMSGPIEPSLAVWDMTTSVGPITGPALHEAWMERPVDTPEGELIFDQAEFTATFTAEVMTPSIATDPSDVSHSLAPGETVTLPLTILNSGMAQLDWMVEEDAAAAGGVLRSRAPAFEPSVRAAGGEITGLASAVNPGVPAVAHPFPDVRGEEVVLTHSETLDIQAENTQVCSPDGGFTTRPNQFLRVFSLEDFYLTSDFDVTEVTFGVELLRDTDAEIDVNLYTLEGDLAYGNMTSIGSATETLEPQEMTLVTVPVAGTAPADSKLVVEIAAPDLADVGAFFPGSNAAGESARSYLAASDCNFAEPRPFSIVSEDPVHLVMTVTGSGTVDLPDCGLPDWAEVTPTEGSVPVGEQQSVDVTLDAEALDDGAYSGSLCLASNDPERSILPVALDLNVSDNPGVGEAVSVPAMNRLGLIALVLAVFGLGCWTVARSRTDA